MGSGAARIYNIVTIIFIVLTLLLCGWVATRFVAPPVEAGPGVVIPTEAVLPTVTPSATATATDLPTFTPVPTQTLVPSITPIPSSTPSLTPTITLTLTPSPSATITTTATITGTPLPTETGTATTPPTPLPSPTGPTPSPFPFAQSGDTVSFGQNFANSAGCAWQGIGGQVFDINNQPLTGIRVRVYGQGFDTTTTSGTNSLYGPAGWEVTLATTISSSTYVVELQSQQGTVISPAVTVAFPGSCTSNLGQVNFQQTRPF
jgi:hypothetical protein